MTMTMIMYGWDFNEDNDNLMMRLKVATALLVILMKDGISMQWGPFCDDDTSGMMMFDANDFGNDKRASLNWER